MRSTGKKSQDSQLSSYQNTGVGNGEISFRPFSGPCKRPRGIAHVGTQHPPPRSLPRLPPAHPPRLRASPFLNFHHTSSLPHNPLLHFSLHFMTTWFYDYIGGSHSPAEHQLPEGGVLNSTLAHPSCHIQSWSCAVPYLSPTCPLPTGSGISLPVHRGRFLQPMLLKAGARSLIPAL